MCIYHAIFVSIQYITIKKFVILKTFYNEYLNITSTIYKTIKRSNKIQYYLDLELLQRYNFI